MRFVNPVQFTSRMRAPGKLAAFDVGTKVIGVSLSDDTRTMAFPATTFKRNKDEILLSRDIESFLDEKRVKGVVVGVPLLDGKATEMAQDIVQLMLRLDVHPLWMPNSSKRFPLHFTLWSEANTTVRARRLINQVSTKRKVYKRSKDEVAATLILKRFLWHMSRKKQ
mgnify:CR=1 FL=1|jgi:putative transcription antitermination factor YqgF